MTLSFWIIRADLLAADRAIEEYKKSGFKEIKSIAAYHLQQAAEKLIKIQIYSQIGEPDDYQLYTHNLEKLIIYANKENLQIDVPQYVRNRSQEITRWEAASRYDLDFSIRIDTLEKASKEMNAWLERIK